MVNDAVPGFARKLAHSSSRRTRDKGMDALAAWLAGAQGQAAGDGDLRRVWKGLFYMMWHADRDKAQRALADRMGALVSDLPAAVGLRYVKAFFVTMRREWHGIDKLRLDKYYYLVRCVVRHLFVLAREARWDIAQVDAHLNVLHRCVNASRVNGDAAATLSAGLPMHVADVYLAEICAACEVPRAPELPPDGMVALLEPWLDAASSDTSDTRVVGRASEAVFCGLLNLGREGGKYEGAPEGAAHAARREVVLAVKRAIFRRASSEDTGAKAAELLYELHSMYEMWESEETAGKGETPAEEENDSEEDGDLGDLDEDDYDAALKAVLTEDADEPSPVAVDEEVTLSSKKKRRRREREPEFVAVPFDADVDAEEVEMAEPVRKSKSKEARKAAKEAEDVTPKKASKKEKKKKKKKSVGFEELPAPSPRTPSSAPKIKGVGTPKSAPAASRAPRSVLKRSGGAQSASPKKSVSFVLDRNEVNEFPLVRGERTVCEPNMVQALRAQMQRAARAPTSDQRRRKVLKRAQRGGGGGGRGARGGVDKGRRGGTPKGRKGGRSRASDFF